MKKIDFKNSDFVVNTGAQIREVMEAITGNQRGAVLVVDDDFFLQGIIADGDIRRAMLKGATMETPALKIVNMSSINISPEESTGQKAEEIFKESAELHILPVVGENNKLVDVLVRDPEKRKEL